MDVLGIPSTRFILVFSLFYSSITSSYLSICIFCNSAVIYLKFLFFKVLINLSATTDFFFIMCRTHFHIIFIWFHWSYSKILTIYLRFICFFSILTHLKSQKSIGNCNFFFFSFKGKSNSCLAQISIPNDKYRNPWLNLLINWIFVRSALQVLYLKDEYTFYFSHFIVIGLFSYLAIC